LKIHIIGSGGYIGRNIFSFLKKESQVVCYSRKPESGDLFFELTRPDDFDFREIQSGDYVVFLAAVSSPDICENEFDYAYAINVIGTKEYIVRLIERKANVLFFSSDVVIGETKFSSDENCICNPVGKYARMKMEIEGAFAGDSHFKIFRLSYVFSRDNNFFHYLNQCTRENKTAEVFDGLKRNAIYLYDILESVKNLSIGFNDYNNAIFHLCGPELLSRKDIADYYRRIVAPCFKYNIVDPPCGFFDVRPNIIETRSLYLFNLLNRDTTTIECALKKEFNL
jgi:dTDP-4-dehydrorhamnose reductase